MEEKLASSERARELIYYKRELLGYSLEQRRVELVTITANKDMNEEREEYLEAPLFPEPRQDRPFKFKNRQTIFLSARVHPGEV